MGRHHTKSHTLPSSPTHSFSSSSSSDFEFTISLSPRKSSAALCPADELFYKGQLLPLHLSPRLSMVRTLLLSSSSTSSSSDTTTTASRDSTASHSSSDSSTDLLNHLECDSSRPSSVTDDEFKRIINTTNISSGSSINRKTPSKYFSLTKYFRKENSKTTTPNPPQPPAVKRVSSSAKEVIYKYLKKVKPLYEKLSQKRTGGISSSSTINNRNIDLREQEHELEADIIELNDEVVVTQSFSGNLRYPMRTRRNCVSSCPSSMRSSPSHAKNGFGFTQMGRSGGTSSITNNNISNSSSNSNVCYSDNSSMEELQSAIQGAIAHCKNSMLQTNKSMVTVSTSSSSIQ